MTGATTVEAARNTKGRPQFLPPMGTEATAQALAGQASSQETPGPSRFDADDRPRLVLGPLSRILKCSDTLELPLGVVQAHCVAVSDSSEAQHRDLAVGVAARIKRPPPS